MKWICVCVYFADYRKKKKKKQKRAHKKERKHKKHKVSLQNC